MVSATKICNLRFGRVWTLGTVGALSLALTGLPGRSGAQQGYGQPQYGQQQPDQPGYPNPANNPHQQDAPQADPPSRVARLSMLQGNVSLQPAGVQDFSAAAINYPLTTGDRLYTDNGSLAELEVGGLALRLGGATDLSVTALTDQAAQLGLAQGSVHLRSYVFDPNATLELDTPNVAVTVLGAGDIRVDVSPDGQTTQATLISGQARVDGDRFQQMLQPGESLQLTGANPVYAQDVRRPRPDALDRFSLDRDNLYQSSIAADGDYVNPGTIGAADLGAYGDWTPDSDYGPVWYPRAVAADWQPYSVGHWAYIAPWGWTWVENEPWGFAPFHYGRWVVIGGRWGWVPGPPVIRPVYSPALVAFVGGGVGVTAWFPLGPRETYVPWYRTSALYANRVNVTNIYSRNNVEVRNIYNQRTTNVYINNTTANRVYVNRASATVAVPQTAFAGGRPVREATLRMQPGQLSQAPVLAHPVATPTRTIMAPTPARTLPPQINRPPVESRGAAAGQVPAYNRGNAPQPGAPSQPGFRSQPAPGTRPGGFGNQPGQAAPAQVQTPPQRSGQPAPVPAPQRPQQPTLIQPMPQRVPPQGAPQRTVQPAPEPQRAPPSTPQATPFQPMPQRIPQQATPQRTEQPAPLPQPQRVPQTSPVQLMPQRIPQQATPQRTEQAAPRPAPPANRPPPPDRGKPAPPAKDDKKQ